MGRIWHTAVLAPNCNNTIQSMDLSAQDVLRIICATNVESTATILPMQVRNGASLAWKNDASVLVAMDIQNCTCPRCAIFSESRKTMLFASNVESLGSVLFASQRSVLRFNGLLERILVFDVQILLSVVVPVDLCVSIQLVHVPTEWTLATLFASRRPSLQSMAKNRSCRFAPVCNACEIKTWFGNLSGSIGATSVAIARVARAASNYATRLQPLIVSTAGVSLLPGITHITALSACVSKLLRL